MKDERRRFSGTMRRAGARLRGLSLSGRQEREVLENGKNDRRSGRVGAPPARDRSYSLGLL